MTSFTAKWRNIAAKYRTLELESDDYRKAADLIERMLKDCDRTKLNSAMSKSIGLRCTKCLLHYSECKCYEKMASVPAACCAACVRLQEALKEIEAITKIPAKSKKCDLNHAINHIGGIALGTLLREKVKRHNKE